ncbi:MAG: AmmeMemoRadiSam system radical SAM enzyme [Chloroflexi bacterium]|nr:AmmeMemoRadiSam system radical SAM enzyme [Chloroflexota bacterium]
MEKEAILYERLSGDRIKCHVCQWRCVINPGKTGLCRVRLNRDGKLYTTNYGEVSSVAADPIEKKPLFHFFPATRALSLGTWGCNFHCKDCQNWEISCVDVPTTSQYLSPEQAIELTGRYGCAGIAWTYNEPTIWFEYTLDSAKLAKQNDLYTVYVTNGYATPEALDTIGPYLDAWRVDVKGFSDSFYRQLAKVSNWRGILDVAKRAKEKWDMHVEVVTNIIPTMNDDEEQLEGIATWIRDSLGELTPWHVTRFHPMYNLTHLPPTPVSTLERACRIGKQVGLKFVYLGNVPGHEDENTVCYSCGKLDVRRIGYDTKVVGLDGSKCKFCGAELNFRTTLKAISDVSVEQELHPIAKLAKETVEACVREGKKTQPGELTPEMSERAGVFVSIHKHGELRGCIGTFEPAQANVAEEIMANAISSATRDPRFPPVTVAELDDLEYKVDILTKPEAVNDVSELDAERYGVIVESGFRKGLLLPDLEGVDSVEEQIAICRLKAGIGPDEPVDLYRFEVRRFK